MPDRRRFGFTAYIRADPAGPRLREEWFFSMPWVGISRRVGAESPEMYMTPPHWSAGHGGVNDSSPLEGFVRSQEVSKVAVFVASNGQAPSSRLPQPVLKIDPQSPEVCAFSRKGV
jgi:hypothetical protein